MDLCKHCGKKDILLDDLCLSCKREQEKKQKDKIDWQDAQEKGVVFREDSVMCPYCGYVQEEDLSEIYDEEKYTCPECKKESDLEVQWTAHITTKKRDNGYLICLCGDHTTNEDGKCDTCKTVDNEGYER